MVKPASWLLTVGPKFTKSVRCLKMFKYECQGGQKGQEDDIEGWNRFGNDFVKTFQAPCMKSEHFFLPAFHVGEEDAEICSLVFHNLHHFYKVCLASGR